MAVRDLAIGVVGATGLAGRELVRLLDERGFPRAQTRLFGSLRTAGGEVDDDEGTARGTIELLRPGCMAGLDLVFFTAGRAIAAEYVPDALAAGALVIDTSSHFRLDPGVPLVVPEVNADALAEIGTSGVVATPSAAATALAVVLAPLADAWPIRRVVVSTYQGAASAGTRALHRLVRDSVALLSGRGDERRGVPNGAFDCVPLLGRRAASGDGGYELRMRAELEKILGDAPPLSVTAVRVPSFLGTGLAVSIESDEAMTAQMVHDALRPARGLLVVGDDDVELLTLRGVVGSEATHVGRVRDDPSVPNGVSLWIAIDAVIKGRALNAVQVAELLARDRR